ncbi:bifunctional 2-polyprenyl-6-hydroxyphenol methylase/3-demethylubiquinol 3-O-methyltransferase UbiG [Candidatus Bandiella euplotis]|uniref:Ubiquinone biosynthesis O-methyltransferase n=1 Tax=Candidatus Bandiella euplotis TaxID=1664265 RepID=A0ABZ0UJX5_9RICK|nr:bifunctional 2-polyprenyl-6-hydroxyphenol methylase/3-demethylubiquinol 3-O-methyltransferase UbiG [Candidatus Bandiella woodruffii]WPX96415.1 Ubiquinone biosynthesis O-methyltransferase [Candidatus Bandiella woodruffii]
MRKTHNNTTIDKEEVAKFSALAKEWWDESGKFKPLHDINPVRIGYIKEKIINHFGVKNNTHPFTNLKILDIGCGGGILSVPMRRLGASVTGIDPSEQNIKIAKKHVEDLNLEIDFQCTDTTSMGKNYQRWFDVVLNMEVVEHVADVEQFLTESSKLVKHGGLMIISTINKTLKSAIFAKIAAEYILGWIPVGTHQWDKFLKPGQIMKILDDNKMELLDIVGMSYNLLQKEWYISEKLDVNYICCFKMDYSAT